MNLQQIEFNLKFEVHFYRRIRRLVWYFLLIMLIDGSIFCFPISVGSIWFYDSDQYFNTIFVIGLNLSRFIVSTILTLFTILVFVAADTFAVLNRRTKSPIIQYKEKQVSGSFLASELEKLREHHILVCQFTRWINQCFGFIVLVAISCCFVSCIVDCYATIRTFYSGSFADKQFIFLTMFIQQLTNMFIFIYAPYKLESEVIKII